MTITCKIYLDTIEELMAKRNISWGFLCNKHKFSYKVIHQAQEKQLMSPYKLIQLSKVLNVDYHELGDTSNVPKLFLRRLEHGFTGEDVVDAIGCSVSCFYDVEMGRSNNLEVIERANEFYDDLENVENDYKARLLAAVMRY